MGRRPTITFCVLLMLAGCGGPQHGGEGSSCGRQSSDFQAIAADVDAAIGTAIGESSHQGLGRVRQRLTELRPRLGGLGCKPQQQACVDQALASLTGMADLLEETGDHDLLAFDLDSKADTLALALECDSSYANRAVLGNRAKDDSSNTEIGLWAALICERSTGDGRFELVHHCDRATLRQGDRFKLSFELDQKAYVYLYTFNDTGYLQVLFPDPGVKNQLPAKAYFIPQGQHWLLMDDAGGVWEHLFLVASTAPIDELEDLRGRAVAPPSSAKPQQLSAQTRVRGKLDPWITRGIKSSAPIVMDDGGEERQVAPVVVKSKGVAAVEFRIYHAP